MMDANLVEQLIIAIRQKLEWQKAQQQIDLKDEDQDFRISEELRRRAKRERFESIRETRNDIRFGQKLAETNTAAERFVEQLFKDEVKADDIINTLQGTIDTLEKKIMENDTSLRELSKEIMGIIARQEDMLRAFVARIADITAREAALSELLQLEVRKKKLMEDKVDLLQENIVWRNRVAHDRQLIQRAEQQKLQDIEKLEKELPKEEGDRREEEAEKQIRKDEALLRTA